MRLSVLLACCCLAGCRIETRPPAGAGSQTTISASVAEHFRARAIVARDSLQYTVLRRQTEVHRDLASVWVTLRATRRSADGAPRDTTLVEHLLLRRTSEGWVVLEATPVGAP